MVLRDLVVLGETVDLVVETIEVTILMIQMVRTIQMMETMKWSCDDFDGPWV